MLNNRLTMKSIDSAIAAAMIAAMALVASTSLPAADIPGFGDEPNDILSVDEAFVLTLGDINGDQLSIDFTMPAGYYLYRKKIDIQPMDAELGIQEVLKPAGQLTTDEFFGETQIYRDSISIAATWSGTVENSQIKVLYQGCADLGICYPPQEKVLTLPGQAATNSAKLPQSDIAPASRTASPVGSSLGNSGGISALLSSDDEELLPPDIAFVPSVSAQQGDSLKVRFDVEDGYYLYKDKISASLVNPEIGAVTRLDLPPGKEKDDAYFGMVEVYRHAVEANLLLQGVRQDTPAELSVNYQGCADIGVCFPPQTTVLPVNLLATAAMPSAIGAKDGGDGGSGGSATLQASSNEPAAGTTGKTAQVVAQVTTQSPAQGASQTAGIENTLLTGSIWLIVITFFGLGLLLAFTPCVLPMVPILSSLIVGQGESATTRNSFLLSLTYVLAMAVTYTIAGIIVGLSGENIQIWFQNPWVLSAFALLFVLLSLSMFGFYELQMPPAIQQKLNNMSNNAQGGTYIGAGIMGFLSALVVGPCVTAPLVGALIFIADTGDAFIGGAALFALAMGMGAPLLLIGASCGKLLPRAGAWMETTKAVFGVLMLGLAIWMLSRFIPAPATLALYAALLIVSGIYLGATDSFNSGTTGWQRLFKGVGIVVLVYGMTLLVGAVSGGHSLLQPLRGIMAGNSSNGEPASHEMEFKRVASVNELDAEIAQAASRGQTVMLDFYADWCISCKEMEAFTFTDSEVKDRLKDTVLLQADVTANNSDDKALLKRFGLFGPPGIIFYRENGEELEHAQLVGFMPAGKFVAHLDKYL